MTFDQIQNSFETSYLPWALLDLGLCWLTARVAFNKGLSVNATFWLSVIISPFIMLPVVMVRSQNQKELDLRQIRTGRAIVCHKCSELIKPEAKVCRHCGAETDLRASADMAAKLDNRPAEFVSRREAARRADEERRT